MCLVSVSIARFRFLLKTSVKILNCSRVSASLQCANKTLMSKPLAVRAHFMAQTPTVTEMKISSSQISRNLIKSFSTFIRAVSPLSAYIDSPPHRSFCSSWIFLPRIGRVYWRNEVANIESSNLTHLLIHQRYWCFRDYF